jgi:hypothetical protein
MQRELRACAVLLAVLAAMLLTACGGSDKASTTGTATTAAGGVQLGPSFGSMTSLPGVLTTPPPWSANGDKLQLRLRAIGLDPLTQEGQVVHIHQHLDIFVNGKKEPVPANIGIYDGQFLTELHTHDATGIMHVESPTKRTFDLAQFMGVWGVRFTSSCIGGYCKELTPWRVYVNGKPYAGDPRALQLKAHQEIVFVIGTPPAKIPSSYKFPAGL